MIQYRLLIADDEIKNPAIEESYKKLFADKFDLEFCRDLKSLQRILTSELGDYHALILDINLETWRTSMMEVLGWVTKDLPIVLASGKWENDSTIENLDRLMERVQSFNIIHLLALGQIGVSEYQKSTSNLIKFALDRHYRRSIIALGEDDNVNILHISDPQFGDLHAESAELIIDDLEDLLERLGKHVHFLAITGDITFDGSPSSFQDAKRWLDELVKVIWGKQEHVADRILIVPGNHDVNLRLACGDRVGHDLKTEPPKMFITDSGSREHEPYGLDPFRRFAYDVTHNAQWLDQERAVVVNNSFRYLGLEFLLLNSVVQLNPNNPTRATIEFEKFKAGVGRAGLEVFRVALCHHGPFYKAEQKEVFLNNWDDQLLPALQSRKVRMFIHGHGHDRKVEALGAGVANAIIRVMAPTTHLVEKKRGERRDEKARRGVNWIQLDRKDGKVKGVTVWTYEYRESALRPVKEEGDSWPVA